MSIRKLTNALYPTVEGVYDDITELYYPNYYDDPVLFAITGWDSSSSFTKANIRLEGDGQLVFFTDDNTPELNWLVYEVGTVFTEQAKIDLKKYLNRNPVITYLGLSKYGKDAMTDNGDGTHYIDVPYAVDQGQVFEQLNLTERWYFPSSGPFDQNYPQSISFTDTDTGNSSTENYSILYAEVSGANQPWGQYNVIGHNFTDATSTVAPYVDTYGNSGATFEPLIGPAYVGDPSIPVGNRTLTEPILQGFLGEDTSLKHFVYKDGLRTMQSKTQTTWKGSANKGYFGGQNDWTLVLDFSVIGPQDATEYTAVQAETNQFDPLLFGMDGLDEIIKIRSYVNNYQGGSANISIIDGDGVLQAIAWPDTLRAFDQRLVLEYKYNSGDGSADVTVHKRPINSVDPVVYKKTTTTITNAHNRSITSDITLNGGDGEIACCFGATNMMYIDGVALDPDTADGKWLFDYKEFSPSMLCLGDSYTGIFPTGDTVYANELIGSYKAAGAENFGIHAHYTQDYVSKDLQYTLPSSAIIPAWANAWAVPASPNRDFIYIMDRLRPISCLLAYTGINYELTTTPAKKGNPAWDNKLYSEPVWACQEHVAVLDDLGIDYRTWNSVPSNGWQNLIDRAQDSTYPWSSFFIGKTLNTYDVSNDPANNGYILPAYDAGDNIHLNLTGTQALATYLYSQIIGNLLPTI